MFLLPDHRLDRQTWYFWAQASQYLSKCFSSFIVFFFFFSFQWCGGPRRCCHVLTLVGCMQLDSRNTKPGAWEAELFITNKAKTWMFLSSLFFPSFPFWSLELFKRTKMSLCTLLYTNVAALLTVTDKRAAETMKTVYQMMEGNLSHSKRSKLLSDFQVLQRRQFDGWWILGNQMRPPSSRLPMNFLESQLKVAPATALQAVRDNAHSPVCHFGE